MIKRIDIENFGIFNEYMWNRSIGVDNQFQRVNIIYGRNYSGKTTLSRIFRCIEKGELHQDHIDSKFSLDCHDGSSISHISVTGLIYQDKVRVYNTDFVSENLSWIHSADGTIQPFTILGSRNIEIDSKIKELEKKLGSIDTKAGHLFELNELEIEYRSKLSELRKKEDYIQNKLRSKANDSIKVDKNLFLPTSYKRTYNINDIHSDISIVQDDCNNYIINSEDKTNKIKFLSEQPKPPILTLPATKPNFDIYYNEAISLLTKEIRPSEQITELINDTILQEWVRHGIEYHKGKRKSCALCGNTLTENLWNKLDTHFSQESEILRQDIDSLIEKLDKAKNGITNFLSPNISALVYTILYPKLEELLSKWKTATDKYISNADYLISILKQRSLNIFQTHEADKVENISNELLELIIEFNNLIDENNKKTSILELEQQKIRKELRLSTVAEFIKDIDLKNQVDEIENLTLETSSLEKNKKKLDTIILTIQSEKAQLETSTKDESRGAELVNKHISDFFGHDELKLVAEGKSPNIKFTVFRDGQKAKNLSEGECSLISFCYFIARIEDEMKDAVKSSQLILYIDDPISSLDGNHIFFMFSLIESIIAKPKKYGQLFISTHNLDFLKYLKRLTIPVSKQNLNHFLIERRHKRNDKRSYIILMPTHIREYVTEFNYLFEQIYEVYKEVKGDKKSKFENTYNQFYNLPNNLRKFLECYLFYKYPNNTNPLENLDKLFDGTVPALINRVINEYSHLTYIDRGWKPIDVDEVEECAKIVIEKINEKDPEQFAALLESIKL